MSSCVNLAKKMQVHKELKIPTEFSEWERTKQLLIAIVVRS